MPRTCWILCVWVALLLASPTTALRAEESEAARVLQGFLTAEQAGPMQVLGNWLATYNLTELQVKQLIAAAGATTSEERRNLLWHAIRCTRSKAAREFLLRNLVEDCDDTTKIRYLQSFANFAPFDVPLLIALYQAGGQEKASTDKRLSDPDADVRDAIMQLATRDVSVLAEELNGRPEFLAEASGGNYAITQQRARQAKQAKAELLSWIARNTTIEKHRLTAILPAYYVLDADHQKRLALDILAVVKKPDERARVMPLICRSYGIDLVPYLVRDDEDETSKLGILQALHDLGSSYGYSMSAISHGQSTFLHVSKNDPSPKVRAAATRLLVRLAGGSTDHDKANPK